jgi:hypothetical protein
MLTSFQNKDNSIEEACLRLVPTGVGTINELVTYFSREERAGSEREHEASS